MSGFAGFCAIRPAPKVRNSIAQAVGLGIEWPLNARKAQPSILQIVPEQIDVPPDNYDSIKVEVVGEGLNLAWTGDNSGRGAWLLEGASKVE